MEIMNPTKEYHDVDNFVFSCQYHVVFCPKYRRPMFKGGMEVRLKDIFEETANRFNFKIIEMEIMQDNVHLIIDCDPKFGIMECVRKLKGASASMLVAEYPDLKSKMPNIWTRSAFIATVGSVSLDVIKKYIENQKGV